MGFTMTEGNFTTADYVAFCILCISSCVGGIWYSALGSRTKAVSDVRDYLLGGKSMSTFPVAMSLVASYVSGVTLLGTPAEIYNYGTEYWLIVISIAMCCLMVAVVYVPVFCKLRLSSSYEYLELRFNRHVRAVASILFLLDEILFLPMVIYVPALAFNQLTGFNEFAVAAIMTVIGGLYTILGGLKAVVWTDLVQTGVMYVGVILIGVAGTVAVGGVKNVIDTAHENGRLDLSNWSFSMYERQTGWGAIFGGFLYWTCFNSVNQTMVQRYIALSSMKKVHWAIGIFCVGAIFAITLCVWNGLVAWTAWIQGGCHPAGTPLVDDRLLPSFVTWVAKVHHLPGLSGVFLAGIFGAGLSSLSVVLNACALVIIEDIMHGWLRISFKPFTEGIFARLATLILAVISVVMLIVVKKLGGVLGVATALSAIAASTTCGIFTLGMVCWWVGHRGAITGAVCGAIVAGTVSLGSQAAAGKGFRWPPMPVSEQSCSNVTIVMPTQTLDPEKIFPLFRLSFHWIAPMGLITTLVVGSIVGWLCDKRGEGLDADLFTPLVWRCLPDEAIQNAGTTRKILSTTSLHVPIDPILAEGAIKLVEIGESSHQNRR